MFHLFKIVPLNFFQIFNSQLKETYSDILFLLYFECKRENSYTFEKEDFINIIKDYFDNHATEIISEEDGKELKNSRDKANLIFRKLKYYGWIDTEFVKNGEQVVNFEDYAIAFLTTYANFESENDIELSSYVHHMYRNLSNIEHDRIYFMLRDTLKQANDLIKKLRSLNSNIKKYIKRIVTLSNKTEEEQLQAILDQLLNEYKLSIIDKAYYYMKTNDNPTKYKSKYIEECHKIRDEEIYYKNAIEQIKIEEKVDEEKATEIFENIIEELENSFEQIIDIISEIDDKNTRYISVAIEKVRILMNHDKNIEGQLLHILKNYQLLEEQDLSFHFFDNRNIITTSLFTPRVEIKVKGTPVKLDVTNDEELDQELYESLKRNQMFSQKAIRKYVDQLLSKKEKVTIHDFDLTKQLDFIRLILIFVYSEEKNNKYKVCWMENEDVIDNMHVPGFTIERKKK